MAGIIAPQYQDEDAARVHLEKILWPDGPICPRCGVIDKAYKLDGGTTRKGLYKCAACRQPFTVTVKTIFEDSKIPLHKWLLAIHLLCSSKKGMSAHQLWRNLWGVNEETGKTNGSYRTAWFMAHRIRWALGQEPLAGKLAGIFEIDETYLGAKVRVGSHQDHKPGERPIDRLSAVANKAAVVTVLQRGGNVRSTHVGRVTANNLRPIIDGIIGKDARIMTDTSTVLESVSTGRKHYQVNHRNKEYVRHEDGLVVTTNSVEGFFATLKRGVNGIYHHLGKQHLNQYLREFDFRHNIRQMNDGERFAVAVKKTSGKRLMLKTPKGLTKAVE